MAGGRAIDVRTGLARGIARPGNHALPPGTKRTCGPLSFGGRRAGSFGVASTETAIADSAYIGEGQTLRQAGHLMRELGVGELGVRGEDGEFCGVLSEDMVVKRIAAGGDPKTVTVGEALRRSPPGRQRASRHGGQRRSASTRRVVSVP